MNHPVLSQRGRLWLYLAVWLLLSGMLTVLVGSGGAGPSSPAGPPRWSAALALTLPLGLLYAILCLGSWYPSRALPVAKSSPRTLLASHGGAAVISAAVWVGVGYLWAQALGRSASFSAAAALFDDHWLLFVVVGVLAYLLAVAVNYLLLAVEASREAEARALELTVLAREAELKALRSQLNPHFLFNALNAISSLTGSDPAAARAMTVELAAFLRSSLHAGQRLTIPLADELALTSSYLAIEHARFGDRLRVVEEVDVSCRDLPVPPLLLQPLVENAVRHGIAHRLDGGELWVTVHRLRGADGSERLRLCVENECDPERPRALGRGYDARSGEGLGLSNVQRRLRLVHGDRATLTVRDSGSQFRVTIELPAIDTAVNASANAAANSQTSR
jgi:hypothetical protein